jgi:hypothetical protein
MVLFSALMAASLPVVGVGAVPVPSDPAEPVVTPGAVFAPEDCAVPALLVPGALAAPVALEAPAAPPALWARHMVGEIAIALAAIATVANDRIIGISLYDLTGERPAGSGKMKSKSRLS